jgi:hypothetical protein
MGRNNMSDINSFFLVMTGFVKKLVKWCKQNGTSSNSLIFLEKPLKLLRTKLKILQLHQIKFEIPKF